MKSNFFSLNQAELLTATKTLVAEERKVTLLLIEHLREIERRMIFLEMGYGSLTEFAIKYLGLSGGSAHRRIATMRLMRDVPESKGKIESGELSITNAAKIETSFRAIRKNEPLTHEIKKEIITECLGATQQECEATLLKELPSLIQTPAYSEKKRTVDAETVEIRLVIPNALQTKIERLMLAQSHVNPEQSYVKLVERLVDQELKKKESAASVPKPAPSVGKIKTTCSDKNVTAEAEFESSRYIPKKTRMEVFARAKNQCEFPGCQSKYLLEIDHQIPFSKNGTHELNNLRVLCKNHNGFEATRILGVKTMRPFLSGLR